ncbi:Crp/Fnr family transcriptional regulator [Vibrio nigripulchritudo]|uniref:Crp/Fnr family transcriptional regulator n=1 Tax=Vibrio nigripulchritudo TaxID=28173 RepID=UPI0024921385|nr:Crp/Fnr family transcriptional regulator [Vibrio nigripulchritudo]
MSFDIIDNSNHFALLDEGTKNALSASAKCVSFEPQTVLLHSNQPWTTVFLIESGLVRMYYLDIEGREHNKSFFLQGSILWPITPSLRTSEAGFFIESIETTHGWSWKFDDFQRCFQHSDDWNDFALLWMERVLEDKFSREKDWLQLTASERYLKLLSTTPEFREIPDKHIASYLGVTAESFSRIKKSIQLTK